MPPRDPAAGIDVTRPEPLRVADALAGGKSNFAADRDMAGRLAELVPVLPRVVRAHGEFARDAASWAASRGIRQFIVVGAGMPLRPYLHEAARQYQPDAVMAYACADPVVLGHIAALEASGPGLAALPGGAEDPGGLLAAVAAITEDGRPVFSLGEPACVLLPGALSVMDGDRAREAAAGFAGPLAPGSAVAVCAAHFRDPQAAAEAIALYAPCSPWHDHDEAAVESFFAAAGLEAPRGGPVRAADAGPWPRSAGGSMDVVVLGGVGVKP